MTGALRIEKLRRDHAVENFDCGKSALNRFLVQFAFQNQQANASQTCVAARGEEVVGYHTLVFGQVAFEDAPERLKKGVARHPAPLMVLARLAVSATMQGQKLGAGLLKDAMLRTLQAADVAGLRALAVHAKDAEAEQFYRHFNFEPSPSDPMHMLVVLKDLLTVRVLA